MFPLDADSDFVDAYVSFIDALWLLCVVAVACFTGGLAQYSESARGSTTPTLGGLPVLEPEEARNGGKRAGEKRSARGGIRGTSDDEGSDEADISGDLDKKRKQGPQANFQHKRQRTRMQEGTSPIHAAAASAASSSTSSRPKIALTSTGVQRGDVGSEGRKGAKYVTRSKVMDTTSLAGVDPAVMASRKQGATPTTMADSSTSTDASPPHMARPPSPSGYPFPSMHSAHGQPRTPLVTLEDWEDLKEVWNRCLEMVDVEEPEDVLPVLRGIIHECSWFLHEFEDPSVIFMAPRQVTTPTYVARAICRLYLLFILIHCPLAPHQHASPNLTSTCLAIRHPQLLPSVLSLTRGQGRLRHPVAVPIHAIDIITSANTTKIIATAQTQSTSPLPSIVSLVPRSSFSAISSERIPHWLWTVSPGHPPSTTCMPSTSSRSVRASLRKPLSVTTL